MNPSTELDELLAAVRDQETSADQWRRLDDLLATDPAAIRRYAEYFDLCAGLQHASLHRSASAETGIPGDLIAVKDTAASNLRSLPGNIVRYRLSWFIVASALIVAVFFAGRSFRSGSDLPDLLDDGGVAVLTRAIDVQYADPSSITKIGGAVPAGRINLTAGLVQLEFFGGATLVIEGPADFELRATNRAFCHSGKLRAVVPPQARGFVIETPYTTLVDQGTEFGMKVDPATGADVHVLSGKVELHDKTSKTDVFAGQSVRARAGVRLQPLHDENRFIGPAELEVRSQDRSRDQYLDWKVASRDLALDPRVVLHYSFDDQRSSDRRLKNSARSGDPLLDGAIVGCQWSEGRWPGKSALEFKRPTDRVKIDVPGEFDAVTMTTWVRVDGYDRWLSSLMLTDGYDEREVHWQIGDRGEIYLGVQGIPGKAAARNYTSPFVMTPSRLGQWTHLAVVYDRASRSVTHYVDAEVICKLPLDHDFPVRIGSAELGNWCAPKEGMKNHIRSLNGRMDEFAIFKAALSADEIARLRQTGRPSPPSREIAQYIPPYQGGNEGGRTTSDQNIVP